MNIDGSNKKTKRRPSPGRLKNDLVQAYCYIEDAALTLNMHMPDLYEQVAGGSMPANDDIDSDGLQATCGDFTAVSCDTGVDVDRLFEAVGDLVNATAAANDAASDVEHLVALRA